MFRDEIYEKKINNEINNKPIYIYLIFALAPCFILGILEAITKTNTFYQILAIAFTFIPVIAFCLTKRITKEKAKFHLSLCVWKNMKYWLLSSLLPAILIAIGAIIYYLIFPNEYSGIFKIGLKLGTNTEIIVKHHALIILLCILVSSIFIPIQLLELGEEIGWRGYVLGFQVQKYGARKAVLINGIEWGIAHLPLVYFGFNYSLDNFGAPWTNMLMMIILCINLGIILSFVTIKTKNCMYASIIHGTVNVIGEMPVYFSKSFINGLLGPNPTGIITMIPLIIVAILCLIKLDNKNYIEII